jgi:hypothetical protein
MIPIDDTARDGHAYLMEWSDGTTHWSFYSDTSGWMHRPTIDKYWLPRSDEPVRYSPTRYKAS